MDEGSVAHQPTQVGHEASAAVSPVQAKEGKARRQATAFTARAAPRPSRSRLDPLSHESLGWRLTAIVATSVLVPFLFQTFTSKGVPLWASLVLGLTWLTTLTCVEIVIIIRRVERDRQNEEEVRIAQDQVDVRLSNIRGSLRFVAAIEPTSDGLFRTYYDLRVKELEEELRTTVNNRTIRVHTNHLQRASLVVNSLSGSPDDIVRAVFPFTSGACDLTNLLNQRWWELVYRSATETTGKVHTLERIILYDEQNDLDNPLLAALATFHISNWPHLACVLLPRDQFRAAMNDYSLSVPSDDFAVYGRHYAFVSDPPNASARSGVWSRDEERIALLISAFEDCWADPASRICPPPPGGDNNGIPMTPLELFEFARQLH